MFSIRSSAGAISPRSPRAEHFELDSSPMSPALFALYEKIWINPGINAKADNTTKISHKAVTAHVTLGSIIYCLLGLSIWTYHNIPEAIFYGVVTGLLLFAHFWYVLHQDHRVGRIVAGLWTSVYPIVLAVTEECGAVQSHRGHWVLPQALLAVLWMGTGASKRSWYVLVCLQAVEFLIIFSIEAVEYGEGNCTVTKQLRWNAEFTFGTTFVHAAFTAMAAVLFASRTTSGVGSTTGNQHANAALDQKHSMNDLKTIDFQIGLNLSRRESINSTASSTQMVPILHGAGHGPLTPKQLFLITVDIHSVDSFVRRLDLSVGHMLHQYMRTIDRISKLQRGRIVWVNGTEITVVFEGSTECITALQQLSQAATSFNGDLVIVIGASFGDVFTNLTPVRGVNTQLILGYSACIEKCRDLASVAKVLPAFAVCDGAFRLMVPADACTAVEVKSPRMALDCYVVNFTSPNEGTSNSPAPSTSPPVNTSLFQPYATEILHSPHQGNLNNAQLFDLPMPQPQREEVLEHSERRSGSKSFMSDHQRTFSVVDPMGLGVEIDFFQAPDTFEEREQLICRSTPAMLLSNPPALSHAPPPGVPEEVWIIWRRCDNDGDGEIDAEEMWGLLQLLGIPVSPEKYFEFLQAVDEDGSCSVSLEEFMKAYNGHVLGGLLLKSKLLKAAEDLKQRGDDALNIMLQTWKAIDRDKTGELTTAKVVKVIHALGVECEEQDVDYLCKELDCDVDKVMRVEDFAALFTPNLPAEDLAFMERRDAVERVMGGDTIEYSTDAQLRRDEAERVMEKSSTLIGPVMLLYILYAAFEIPVVVPLGDHETVYNSFVSRKLSEIIYDGLLLMWVGSKFFLPREHQGITLFEKSDIRRQYINTTDFLIDLIAAVPLDIIALALRLDHTNVRPEILEALRINKLVLLWYVNRLYTQIFKSVDPTLSRIAHTMLWWILIINTFAAMFIGAMNIEDDSHTITGVSDYLNAPVVLIYAQAFDWAVKTMVGLNRGPSMPTSDVMAVLLVLVVIVGVLAYSIILSTITNAVNIRDSRAIANERLEEVAGFLDYSKVPEDLFEEVIGYYKHMFDSLGSTNPKFTPLNDLPCELTVRLSIQHANHLIRNIHAFQGLDNQYSFLNELMLNFQTRAVMPSERLVSEGDAVVMMCVVVHGTLMSRVSSTQTVQWLRIGDYFGDFGLIHSIKSHEDVICHSSHYANVLTLKKVDYAKLAREFPECGIAVADNVRNHMKLMIRSWGRLEMGDSHDDDGAVDHFLEMHSLRDTGIKAVHQEWCEKLKMSTSFRPFLVE
eukprot:PhF_6_TR11597/c0_g1_i1/m.18777